MRILVIDDDRTVCASLSLLLKRKSFEVDVIHRPNEAMDRIESYKPDLILLDMNFSIDTSGRQGLRLLQLIREESPNVFVILMTGWATVQLAVEGMKLGALDFIAKPWENKSLLDAIHTIQEMHWKPNAQTNPEQDLPIHQQIIGVSEPLKQVLNMVERVAPTNASVLITGESGTGKELIAEAIHQLSHRTDAPFVKVNLGGIPSSLFESEMFGHRKGAFTGAEHDREGKFAKADKGTIFLDEIGELELSCQVKLLRVLQEKSFEKLGSNQIEKVDFRLISATNRDLKSLSANAKFREDLYYRINLIHINLPPLRERKEDITPLIKYFVRNIAQLYEREAPYIDDGTLRWLSMQEYKGNIRQLKNIVERSFLLHLDKMELTKKDFDISLNSSLSPSAEQHSLNLARLEIDTIKRALALHDHAISAASKSLGITRSALYRRIEKYNIIHEPKI